MADKTKALKEQGGEETTLDTTPVSEEKATVDEVEAEEPVEEAKTDTVAEAETEETEDGSLKPPKKGVQQRISELTQKVREKEELNKSLADRLAEVTSQFGTPPLEVKQPQPPVAPEPLIRPGEEIDTTELERRQQVRDQRLLQQARSEMHFLNQVNQVTERINREARDVIDVYPQLNPKHTEFDKELSESVTEAAEAYAKTTPTGSIRKFVDKMMRPYQRAVQKEVGEQRENLAKQVSQQAVRPTAVTKSDKEFKDLSIAEMEARLGIVHP